MKGKYFFLCAVHLLHLQSKHLMCMFADAALAMVAVTLLVILVVAMAYVYFHRQKQTVSAKLSRKSIHTRSRVHPGHQTVTYETSA